MWHATEEVRKSWATLTAVVRVTVDTGSPTLNDIAKWRGPIRGKVPALTKEGMRCAVEEVEVLRGSLLGTTPDAGFDTYTD